MSRCAPDLKQCPLLIHELRIIDNRMLEFDRDNIFRTQLQKSHFHHRLLAALTTNGLTQVQLHKLTLIPQPTISSYIRSTHRPRVDKLILLADALSVTASWLADINNGPEGLDHLENIEHYQRAIAGLADYYAYLNLLSLHIENELAHEELQHRAAIKASPAHATAYYPINPMHIAMRCSRLDEVQLATEIEAWTHSSKHRSNPQVSIRIPRKPDYTGVISGTDVDTDTNTNTNTDTSGSGSVSVGASPILSASNSFDPLKPVPVPRIGRLALTQLKSDSYVVPFQGPFSNRSCSQKNRSDFAQALHERLLQLDPLALQQDAPELKTTAMSNELAAACRLSTTYTYKVLKGQVYPSPKVLSAIAHAINLSPEDLLLRAHGRYIALGIDKASGTPNKEIEPAPVVPSSIPVLIRELASLYLELRDQADGPDEAIAGSTARENFEELANSENAHLIDLNTLEFPIADHQTSIDLWLQESKGDFSGYTLVQPFFDDRDVPVYNPTTYILYRCGFKLPVDGEVYVCIDFDPDLDLPPAFGSYDLYLKQNGLDPSDLT